MNEETRRKFFPMRLPSGVVARSMDWDAAQESIQVMNHLIFPPGFKQELGLFQAPEERREKLGRLRELYAPSQAEWIVFFSKTDEPIGWFYGYMEDEETFFIDTIGLVPAYRGRGIYSAFLRELVAYLRALDYERVTTSHHPNNRAVMIPELKAGFCVVGMELYESHGPLVKMAYLIQEDRREGFQQVFHLGPDPASEE